MTIERQRGKRGGRGGGLHENVFVRAYSHTRDCQRPRAGARGNNATCNHAHIMQGGWLGGSSSGAGRSKPTRKPVLVNVSEQTSASEEAGGAGRQAVHAETCLCLTDACVHVFDVIA